MSEDDDFFEDFITPPMPQPNAEQIEATHSVPRKANIFEDIFAEYDGLPMLKQPQPSAYGGFITARKAIVSEPSSTHEADDIPCTSIAKGQSAIAFLENRCKEFFGKF